VSSEQWAYMEVLGGDVSLLVLHFQMFELRRQSLRLVKQVNDDFESGKNTHGVSDELGWAGVVAVHALEKQRTRLRNLREDAATHQQTMW